MNEKDLLNVATEAAVKAAVVAALEPQIQAEIIGKAVSAYLAGYQHGRTMQTVLDRVITEVYEAHARRYVEEHQEEIKSVFVACFDYAIGKLLSSERFKLDVSEKLADAFNRAFGTRGMTAAEVSRLMTE